MSRYGCNPDRPDMRDLYYAAPFVTLLQLPTAMDLTHNCPPVRDQGQLGSCTAFAISGALMYDQLMQGEVLDPLSELFIYYNERLIEHDVYGDYGASIKDGVKSVNKTGACTEALWPYDIAKFANTPSADCYQDAKLHSSLVYMRVLQNIQQMKGCIASEYPFIAGITVYESFESQSVTSTGIIPMPQYGEKVLGGHAILIVGYDDSKQTFTFQNSWSENWGDHGYGYLPYAYLVDQSLASDFWTIRKVK